MVILALDEGTTSARAILFDKDLNVLGVGQYEFPQLYPRPGYVEHNPEEIWNSQLLAIKTAMEKAHIDSSKIDVIGITNQRETTVLWDSRLDENARQISYSKWKEAVKRVMSWEKSG
ncbi:MAG: FGGY family carbohydrate kinase [Candidatus Rehaiarchaeum fermentans]|nr:FGGY family carbohydrate kinase [Candidatus Rehaiarchaeum fermentans]